MKPSFAIVGCGKVGSALARFLTAAGYRAAGLASKSLSSAQRVAEMIGTKRFSRVNWEVTKSADIVFITTPDGVIGEACRQIAGNNGLRERSIVLHCSGSLSSEILFPAKECGASIGSMHPLQSFVSVEIWNNPFQGIIISVEGEPQAVDAARKIAADLGATFMEIKTEAKTLYHASAVVASNYLVTLLDLAFRLIEPAGVSKTDALKLLKPLIGGTLSNIEKVGIPEALTGPIERGDAEVLERHMAEIASKVPELMTIYKALSLYTIGVARKKGTLSESRAQMLKGVLGK